MLKADATSVRISGSDWNRLREVLFTPDKHENAAVLLCGTSIHRNRTTLLVRRVVPVPTEDYLERLTYHLEIAPRFYNSIVDRAASERLVPVICHSHPFDGPAHYSSSDDFGEKRLLPVLESLLPGQKPGSLLVTYSSVSGRQLDQNMFRYFHSIITGGARYRTVLIANGRKRASDDEMFQRQRLAFGPEGQEVLSNLTVAIVGLGGIGSLMAEEVVRSGVERLIIVDFDKVEASNLSRLFGGTADSIGHQKTEVAEQHLTSLRNVAVEVIADSVVRQSVLMQLRNADLVLSCVDSDLARSILSRFAHQYLIPVIDSGIRLDARKGKVTAAAGRVSVVGPDSICLRCSHHINPERIRAESLPASERAALRREGYVMGIDDPAPAVVTLNGVVASLGATAAMNLFVNLTGAFQPPNQLYDATTGTVFTALPTHEPGCDICDEREGVKALGDQERVSAYD